MPGFDNHNSFVGGALADERLGNIRVATDFFEAVLGQGLSAAAEEQGIETAIVLCVIRPPAPFREFGLATRSGPRNGSEMTSRLASRRALAQARGRSAKMTTAQTRRTTARYDTIWRDWLVTTTIAARNGRYRSARYLAAPPFDRYRPISDIADYSSVER